MGASEWIYYAGYSHEPEGMLLELRQQELAGQSYYWADARVARPGTLDELYRLFSDERNEVLAMEGTHSILDIWSVLPAGSPDEYGAIRPLSGDEVRAALGTDRPTRDQFDTVYRDRREQLVDFPRWSGRYTTLYRDGEPTETVVWGVSGD